MEHGTIAIPGNIKILFSVNALHNIGASPSQTTDFHVNINTRRNLDLLSRHPKHMV